MNAITTVEHPTTTVTPSEAASSSVSRPEFYRLPKSGGDPFFGFTRSFYYEGETRGYWTLTRIRAGPTEHIGWCDGLNCACSRPLEKEARV